MAGSVLSGQDAVGRVHQAKMPTNDVGLSNVVQMVANNASVPNTQTLVTRNMGNPVTVRVFITASGAGTISVSHSPDNGVTTYHDTANDIVFAGGGTKIVDIKGASVLSFVPSATLTLTLQTMAMYQ